MFIALRNTIPYSWCGLLLLGVANAAGAAAPTLGGQSGYVNMPSAVTGDDGTFTTGYSFDQPYGTIWATATIFPFLQVTGRYVSINGIPGFTNVEGQYGSEYGRFKDKVVGRQAAPGAGIDVVSGDCRRRHRSVRHGAVPGAVHRCNENVWRGQKCRSEHRLWTPPSGRRLCRCALELHAGARLGCGGRVRRKQLQERFPGAVDRRWQAQQGRRRGPRVSLGLAGSADCASQRPFQRQRLRQHSVCPA